jgi:predicted nucleic acid-binding protein
MLNGRVDTIVTPALLDELLDVIGRPRLARYEIDDAVFGAILELVWPGMPGVGIEAVLRDVDDRIVVEAAVGGAADAIVTGDKELLDDADLIAWAEALRHLGDHAGRPARTPANAAQMKGPGGR